MRIMLHYLRRVPAQDLSVLFSLHDFVRHDPTDEAGGKSFCFTQNVIGVSEKIGANTISARSEDGRTGGWVTTNALHILLYLGAIEFTDDV